MAGQAFSNVKEMAATSTVPHWKKGSASKIQVPCPNVIKMNDKGIGGADLISDVIKIYKKGIDGVDLMDHSAAAYHLDRKLLSRFYLGILFDFIDVVCAKSYIVYNMIHPNDLKIILKDFKIMVSNA